MQVVAIALVLAGCGRVGFDTYGGTADATSCTGATFGPPVRLAGPVQTPVDDWFPTPALGQTVLFLHTFGGSAQGAALWFAVRPDRSSEFGPPTLVSELDTANDEKSPSVTEDGLELVFARYAGTSTGKLYRATRETATAAWNPATLISTLDSTGSTESPWLSADGLRIVFSSSRTGPNLLFEATRASRLAEFGAPLPLAELHTGSSGENTPTLSTDGLEILFSSVRPGGPGGYDIYTARRPTTDQPFGTPMLVSELSSPRDDYGLRLASDDVTLYFNYDALVNGGANADLWVATRSCN